MNEEERRSAIQMAYQLQDSIDGIYQGHHYTGRRTPGIPDEIQPGYVVILDDGRQGAGETPNEALQNALSR